jgi:hypothetical protein
MMRTLAALVLLFVAVAIMLPTFAQNAPACMPNPCEIRKIETRWKVWDEKTGPVEPDTSGLAGNPGAIVFAGGASFPDITKAKADLKAKLAKKNVTSEDTCKTKEQPKCNCIVTKSETGHWHGNSITVPTANGTATYPYEIRSVIETGVCGDLS